MKPFMRTVLAVCLCAAVFACTLLSAPAADAASDSTLAGLVSVSSGSLNVRSAASTSSSIVSSLPKGSTVTLIARSGNWWRVQYASNRYGYVSASFITRLSRRAGASVTASHLNVRTGAGTSYAVKALLKKGTTVTVLSSGGGWSRILYNGSATGYVSSAYLSIHSMAWPVPASTRLNQQFAAGRHNGMDIGAATPKVEGDVIVAAVGGTAVHSGWLSGYGYVLYVNSYFNGRYIQTRYAHLKTMPYVAAGNPVTAGQTIGALGNTGTSSGAHLHFEVRLRKNSGICMANADSTPVDPAAYISY